MKKNLKDPTAHVSARRRLVRGAFAAPVALTLYNGSAFAATSISCVAKEIANPTYPTNQGSSSADTYLRVQLWTLAAGTPSNWVRGADVVFLQKSGTSVYITSSQWQCFSAGSSPAGVMIQGNLVNPPVAGTIYAGQPTRNNGATVPLQNGAYVAIRVDTNGNIVGVVGLGTANPGTSAVHQSCWTSFRATTP